jgi:signal transduction histidine kinase/HAMP domain-containing protein
MSANNQLFQAPHGADPGCLKPRCRIERWLHAVFSNLGMARRVVLLSWLITLGTVLIFVAATIPEQKRVFKRNLESKARGIAVSLRNIAAGAVINEDYSSVVDHCMQLIKGDSGVSYLVMTRRDGFSLVSDQTGWRTEAFDSWWNPAGREGPSGILVAQPLTHRAFHYSQPFEYSGLSWGWIHVGLSVEAYDESVADVYRRTGLLAVVCLCLSLVCAVWFVRPLVRPIYTLETVVKRVAAGDLAARAEIRSRDEIERLANAFNGMTDALQHRDRILESVRFSARQLLATDDWERVIDSVLEKLGQAASTSRALLLVNHQNADRKPCYSLRHRWVHPAVKTAASPRLEGIAWESPGCHAWSLSLRNGGIAIVPMRESSAESRALFETDTLSVIMLPVMKRQHWWGTLVFSQCDQEREWSEAEIDSFRVAAGMFGAAIEGSETRAALLEMNESLERRVLERTAELRAEIEAKEQARAKLAEAQQMLMEVSRKSGMAEVATGVLHNVGNVLNSVNVSASMLNERLRRSRAPEVAKLAALFQEHAGDLPGFFANDPRGRKVLPFLLSLSKSLENDGKRMETELEQMVKNIDHIKQIVVMQQSYAKVAGVLESLPASEIVEDALRITEPGLARHGIALRKRFEADPRITVDKHKILQVLINLIRNARQAVEVGGNGERQVRVTVSAAERDGVRIAVSDTGIGIAPDKLTKIFSYGFTTKKSGHGFGLHMSALAAQEMGGKLSVSSEGEGRGATFTLELPLEPPPGDNTAAEGGAGDV